MRLSRAGLLLLLPLGASGLAGQEPVAWGTGPDAVFHTFSIVARDPATGEIGVAVTTRVPCVGNGVPWVRAGVGGVATQANTRVAYGPELLDALAAGRSPADALRDLVAVDSLAASRQVGVLGLQGSGAQHTGSGNGPWAGGRMGTNYVTQGNLLEGPETVDAVGSTFEASEGSPRHLADRLIEALAAGYAAGGDARKGRTQSAAVIVADARPGRSRRPDGVTANINVCEHPEPVAELRRIYETISQTLGYRTLEQQSGNDVWQLALMLHALGYYRSDEAVLRRGPDADRYTLDLAAAVELFRAEEGLSTAQQGSPPGLVDRDTVDRLWRALDAAGKGESLRRALLNLTAVRR